jgi:hypothetical protein
MLGKITPILIAAVFCVPLFATGCAEHRRVYYDPYYHDQHPWAQENSYYIQWETDTHRHHEDFNKRSKDDQKAYWDWRHKSDHEHDQHPH